MRHLIFFMFVMLSTNAAAATQPKDACVGVGKWVEPATGKTLVHKDFIAQLSKRPVVLLGEIHTNPEHHRWQLHVIAALHGLNPNMVLAFEAFPRRYQPVLDKWVNGDLSEDAFLKQVNWNEIWRFDSGFYMPLFNFARMHRIPMAAMNVGRKLIGRIGKDGWDAIPEDAREGVSDPAPATDSYLNFLSTVFGQHGPGHKDKKGHKGKAKDETIKAPPIPELRNNPMFMRFVQSQTTWDRAMAQIIAEARARKGKPLVVGIVGQGHIQYGFGIPHQLADLGVKDAAVLLPWNDDQDCADLDPVDGNQLATAVFGVAAIDTDKEPKKPKLGVYIEDDKDGVRIDKIVEKSVAKAAGLIKDDVIVEAAGKPIAKVAQLVDVVSRQAPGTWLPLKIKRAGKTMDIIAKFPPRK